MVYTYRKYKEYDEEEGLRKSDMNVILYFMVQVLCTESKTAGRNIVDIF